MGWRIVRMEELGWICRLIRSNEQNWMARFIVAFSYLRIKLVWLSIHW